MKDLRQLSPAETDRMIAAARAGDSAVMSALIESAEDIVQGAARRVLGPDYPELEDALQEGRIRVYLALGVYDRARCESLAAYLYTQLFYFYKRLRKTNAIHWRILSEYLDKADTQEAARPGVGETAVPLSDVFSLTDVMRCPALSAAQKRLLAERAQGKTYREMATARGISAQAVHRQVARAIAVARAYYLGQD